MPPTLFEVKKANKQGCPNCKSLRFYIRDDRLGNGFRCHDCGHIWGEKPKPPKKTANRGWLKLFSAKEWHYFRANGRSFCEKWRVFTVPDDAHEDDQHLGYPQIFENCAGCLHRLREESDVEKNVEKK